MEQRTYRPDIDGLRAIAVAAVILYHLEIPALSGGFIGVDVFFVISGYLITGFVRRELAENRFSFRSFFHRRVRRLSAPLLLVTATSVVAAYFMLYPEDMYSFSESVIAQPLALQNIHFFVDGEYFRQSETKLLLHTWSLGVEEQFYLIWPLFLFLLRRQHRLTTICIVGVVMAASFGLGLALISISPKASFFLLPARAWELGCGGMLALIEEGTRKPRIRTTKLHSLMSVGAATLLGIGFGWITPEMVFPGWIAILPVGATTILIAHGSRANSFVKSALSWKPLVYIGLISYSLYLWHWPLIVYARYQGFSPSAPGTGVLVIGASVLLSVLTYRFVEQPIRQRRLAKSWQQLLLGVSVVAVILVTLGLLGRASNGAEFRYDEPARSMLTASFDAQSDRCGLAFRVTRPTSPVCEIQSASSSEGVLLWGNSHADMWSGLFRALGKKHGRRVFLNARNCRPITDSDFCGPSVQSSVLEYIDDNSITQVVLASSWFGAYERADVELEEELTYIVQQLTERGIHVWLVVDIPIHQEFDPIVNFESNPSDPSFGAIPIEEHTHSRQRELHLFDSLAKLGGTVNIVDATGAFCFELHCYGGQGMEAWYRDSGHLTNTGARRAESYFTPVFQ